MNMKIVITEEQYNRVINEQGGLDRFPEKEINDIVDRINNSTLKNIMGDIEDYDINEKMFRVFKRGFNTFKLYLATIIRLVETGEFSYLLDSSKPMFIDYILIYTLMDFFYYLSNEEFAVEDFKRKGEHEDWLYLVKNIYGGMLGVFYDEMKDSGKKVNYYGETDS